jgi:hypothetical protein
MKLRVIIAAVALVLLAGTCKSNNPAGVQAPEGGPARNAAPFMGSGH